MSTGVKVAQAPFDDARADLILRSSGDEPVHFRVSKFILSVASPIFADMFNIPLPPPSSQNPPDEIQVVRLSEDSEALELCLRHIYPMRPPKVTQLRQTRILAEFARKYQVDALEHHVLHYLADAVDQDPVGVYAIAVTYGYKSIGIKAAKLSLKLPFSHLQSPHVQCAPAELHGQLLMYHAACGEAASAVTSERNWFSSFVNFHDFILVRKEQEDWDGCSSCFTRDFIRMPPEIKMSRGNTPSQVKVERRGPQCLWNYLHRSTIVLAHHPDVDTVTAEDFVLKECDCARCASTASRDMLGFSKIFGGEINKAIERVPLPKALSLQVRRTSNAATAT